MTPDKHQLRSSMRALRKRLTDDDPMAASRVADHVADLPQGATVALYRAIGSELDTSPLAGALIALGRALCLPVVLDTDAPMIFRRWVPGEPLEMDMAGCPAPLPLAEVVTPDLVILPLLAFDAAGVRLGQGGGYYDRTLAALRRSAPVGAVGLAYAGQQVGHLPVEPHDQPLDGVLTEKGYRAFA